MVSAARRIKPPLGTGTADHALRPAVVSDTGLLPLEKMPVLELLRPYAVPVTLLGILAAWTSIQLLPIPLDVLTTISPNAAEIWTATGTSKAPITLHPPEQH